MIDDRQETDDVFQPILEIAATTPVTEGELRARRASNDDVDVARQII